MSRILYMILYGGRSLAHSEIIAVFPRRSLATDYLSDNSFTYDDINDAWHNDEGDTLYLYEWVTHSQKDPNRSLQIDDNEV